MHAKDFLVENFSGGQAKLDLRVNGNSKLVAQSQICDSDDATFRRDRQDRNVFRKHFY